VQKIGLYALLAILVFAVVFAFLPGSRTESRTGATLQGVQLRLYPARDPDAVWSFRAADVTSDPVTNETHLRALSGGQRVVKERDNKGVLTGREVLDARLSAPELTIDAQDNMLTRQARITLVRECADIDLSGTPEQPVKIEQGSGFSAAVAKVDSPSLTGTVKRLRMSFQFVLEDSAEDSQTSFSLDPTEQCVNGRRIPVPRS
jgi:hypothetical protein